MTVENDDLQSLINAKWLSGFENDKLKDLKKFLNDLDDDEISPEKDKIFNAFKIGNNGNICEQKDVKVLIIGQDPYPNKEKAHGYAFSVKAPKKRAASLTKIFNVLDIYCKKKNKPINSKHNYNLEKWAKEYKVLLLNSALTYEKSKYLEGQYTYKKELSHDNLKKLEKTQQELQKNHIEMWEPFVINIMENLFKKNKNVVVFLWGDKAKSLFNKCNHKENIKSYESCHPQKRHKKGEEDSFLKEVPEHFIASGLDDIWENI